ncbi:hypothetical protein NC653_009155 [Populus alba x Populus x berolinensis]|uniref:Uncharacterized protein n=1 Tax=Populus alba x Populus x berolinensis TaxID=444605 RepID=A0AAD6R891_9ROSI|nr:hypothetical protein NC653_009155 [Populus alba x Populus x berolinensis]
MTSITESVTAFMEVMDQRVAEENPVDRNILVDEIHASDEAKAIELLNLLPRPAVLLSILKNESSKIQIEGFGGVEVNNLRASKAKPNSTYGKAHNPLKLSPTSSDPNGGKIEKMLEEAPSVAAKRGRLSIKLVRDAKDVLSNIMDNISAFGG